ncbi:DUF3667 domain-containing protein [Pedobacter metabolipauper]|uniref:Uncharacterized protein DUF3667 n=1 Tax=Pedobacter metabolipauper TaxID=425513 RepID=A0A4R6T1L5_9SPHI|nr:DUF3667 domain-containing protein [Pedobacter metabolipauper]TDQ11969.1 uncharacterized protein DUF3667 [Pedobacter metabolipauper]
MSGKYRKEHNCLNCGSHVEAHYCSQCGQPNVELKESFWTFIIHSIGHYLHFDSKFFQTLKPLLTKPGLVTLDYIAGKRARYINPVSMYIFVSIVYFLVVPHSKTNSHNTEKDGLAVPGKEKQFTAKSLEATRKELDSNAADFGGVVKYSAEKGYDALVKQSFKNLSFTEQQIYIDDLKKQNKASQSDHFEELITSFQRMHTLKQDSTFESYSNRQAKLPESERDNWFERQIKKRDIRIAAKSAKGEWSIEAELIKYKPKQYFLLMPLLAFFIMLNFRKNHIYYLDHLIFTIHGMTAYFIVSIVCVPSIKYIFGIGSFMGELIEFGIVIWICWYLYKGLKVFYNRSRKATIIKMIWLFILYGASLYITESIIRNTIYLMT